MRIKSLYIIFILLFTMINPVIPVEAAEFFTVTAGKEGFIKVCGQTKGDLVTVRSLFFGNEEPDFPFGADNFEITAEQVRNSEINMNYFNIVEAVEPGVYSADIKTEESGYYLITANSDAGERANRLYRCNVNGDIIPVEEDVLKYSDSQFMFEYGGERFVMMSFSKDEVTVMPYADFGSSDAEGIDSFLNSLDLPLNMDEYVNEISVPEYSFVSRYSKVLGRIDSVGYYNNKNWRILSCARDNRDSEKYEVAEYELGNSKITAADLVIEENLSVREAIDDSETVIEFTAPVDGDYQISTGITGEGSGKLQLTAMQGEKIFDNNSIAILEKNNFNNSTVTLLAGDRVFLHIYPQTGVSLLEYSITSGDTVYTPSELTSVQGGWWILNGDTLYANSIGASNYKSFTEVSEGDRFFVRPVLKLKPEFFAECAIDVNTAGAYVLEALRENFERDELTAYNSYEIDTIYNPLGFFEYEVLPLTDANGREIKNLISGEVNANIKINNSMQNARNMVFIMAVYAENGALLATNSTEITIPAKTSEKYSVSIDATDMPAGAFAKTFLWGSLEGMTPVFEIAPRDLISSELTDAYANNQGNWKIYTKPVGSTNYSEYAEKVLSGASSVSSGNALPFIFWEKNNEENIAYLRPEGTGDLVIEYTVPYKGNWKIEYGWRNVGTDVFGGDGGSLRLSFLPAGETEDNRNIRSLAVNVSMSEPLKNSYNNVIAANGGDKILLSANAGKDGYADKWELCYKISETTEQGKVIGEEYKYDLPVPGFEDASTAQVNKNTVWVGVDGNYSDSDYMIEKIGYFKKYIPNIGVIAMSGNPANYRHTEFFEKNGIPALVQSYGNGYESYIEENNAWEWDWNSKPLNSSHWQDLSGTGHAFSLPHYATREMFSRIAKAATNNGYSGFGFPDYVWMWGARGISGYNPYTIKAFVDDLYERDSGLRCDDGLWFFHDYYRYYTGSENRITPQDLGFNEWSEYRPLSQSQNTTLVNSGVNTSSYWAVFDALCHYEWLKFAQYIADLTHDNGGICQIMPNPEYSPDGVDFLFLNKLVNVDMAEDEYFGNLDWLDGAYYRWNYLSKYDNDIKNGGVMEAGGGGNAGAYYTDEIAWLSAFELGAMEYINHLEVDFMYQNTGFSKERDGQLISYGMGFSAAKELELSKKQADFTVVSSRNHLRPWSFDVNWKPWDLRVAYDSNADFNIAKMGYNFDGISQEGLLHGETDEIVVFSPHRVTESVWNTFIDKLETGEIKTGIMSARRFDIAITDKLSTVDFAEIAPGYTYPNVTDIGLPGHILDASGTTLTTSRLNISGGIAEPISGDETVLSYKTFIKTYPLVVKRDVGEGELYVLLFDDTLNDNFKLAEFVYDYILSEKGVKPVFKSVQNSGTLTEDYTISDIDAVFARDIGVSARVYQNDDMLVAGIQNSLSRQHAATELTSTGSCTPYEIVGSTSAKILAEPDKSYKYIAVPSMQEGNVTADEEGYVTLSFENTSYEIFFLLPSDSADNFDDIKAMQTNWRNALKFEF